MLQHLFLLPFILIMILLAPRPLCEEMWISFPIADCQQRVLECTCTNVSSHCTKIKDDRLGPFWLGDSWICRRGPCHGADIIHDQGMEDCIGGSTWVSWWFCQYQQHVSVITAKRCVCNIILLLSWSMASHLLNNRISISRNTRIFYFSIDIQLGNDALCHDE